MGYLECEKCGLQYELKDNESAEDFSDECDCGGKFVYRESLENPQKEQIDYKSDKVYCIHCGYENKSEAIYCKSCGIKLKSTLGIVEKFNKKINVLAVFVGLFVSLIVLFLSTISLYPLVISEQIDFFSFMYLSIFLMLFIGGVVVGFLVGKKYSNGIINGGFLTLITAVNFGTILAAAWLITSGIAAAIASAFGSSKNSAYSGTGTSMDYSNTASSLSSSETSGTIIQSILVLLVLLFLLGILIIAGPVGGMLGVYLKKLIVNRR